MAGNPTLSKGCCIVLGRIDRLKPHLKAVSPRDIAKQADMQNRLLFLKKYFSAVASNCAAATQAKWTGRLGATDVWTVDNCSAMQLHLRID